MDRYIGLDAHSASCTVVVVDSTRAQRRIKALFRSRGVPTDGKGVYSPSARAEWIASKRAFWAYIGLAVVTRSSSDWARAKDGQWIRAQTMQTRGLNRNFNRRLKDVFKGAATTVIGHGKDEPLSRHDAEVIFRGLNSSSWESWERPLSLHKLGIETKTR